MSLATCFIYFSLFSIDTIFASVEQAPHRVSQTLQVCSVYVCRISAKSETHTAGRIAIAEAVMRIDAERAAAKRSPGATTKEEQLPSAVCP